MDDNLSAVAAGFAGTAVMTALLLAADAVTSLPLRPFEAVAAVVGFQDVAVGFTVFVALGTVAWSFLFITIGQYLPGGSDPVRGMVFAVVLWTGFFSAFAPGVPADGLLAYALFTLLVHLAYGLTLGGVYALLGDHAMTAAEPVPAAPAK